MPTQSYLAQMITVTKSKLAEVKVEYPRRPVILIGWRAGASLACQVAVTEAVTAVVCLGFSANTVEGPRGKSDDSILDVQCPVLFVTGENAASSRLAQFFFPDSNMYTRIIFTLMYAVFLILLLFCLLVLITKRRTIFMEFKL